MNEVLNIIHIKNMKYQIVLKKALSLSSDIRDAASVLD